MSSTSFIFPIPPISTAYARGYRAGTGLLRTPLRRGNSTNAMSTIRRAVGIPPRALLKPGDEVEGHVRRLVHYGAFVDLGSQGTGLVHISEVSDSFVSDISTHLKEGDDVRVRVLSIDRENGRISLSLKRARAAPPSGYDRIVELGGDWGHPWNDDGQAQYADLGPRKKGPEAWEPDPELFRKWDTPDDQGS